MLIIAFYLKALDVVHQGTSTSSRSIYFTLSRQIRIQVNQFLTKSWLIANRMKSVVTNSLEGSMYCATDAAHVTVDAQQFM